MHITGFAQANFRIFDSGSNLMMSLSEFILFAILMYSILNFNLMQKLCNFQKMKVTPGDFTQALTEVAPIKSIKET